MKKKTTFAMLKVVENGEVKNLYFYRISEAERFKAFASMYMTECCPNDTKNAYFVDRTEEVVRFNILPDSIISRNNFVKEFIDKMFDEIFFVRTRGRCCKAPLKFYSTEKINNALSFKCRLHKIPLIPMRIESQFWSEGHNVLAI